MLIFCCVWSPSLCTLALHIARSLWRPDFNRSSLFGHPRPPPPSRPSAAPRPIRQRSFIRYTCIIAYGRFICLPLCSPRPRSRHPLLLLLLLLLLHLLIPSSRPRFYSRASRCDSNNIFPALHVYRGEVEYSQRVFTRALLARTTTPSPVSPSSLPPLHLHVPLRAYAASLKGSFFSLVKPVNFPPHRRDGTGRGGEGAK